MGVLLQIYLVLNTQKHLCISHIYLELTDVSMILMRLDDDEKLIQIQFVSDQRLKEGTHFMRPLGRKIR